MGRNLVSGLSVDRAVDRYPHPRCLAETRQYLLDLNRLETQTSSALELYQAMLELHPDRANPGSLWGAAKRASQPLLDRDAPA